jgi:hypothetical protein
MAAHLLKKISGKVPVWLIKFLGNIWPPYLGAGVKILEVTPDYRYVKVCLKRSWYNTNYVGTQFGGSIYAMTDPFFMLILINNLGSDYIVWDKAASIHFKKPGKTKLFAEFKIDDSVFDQIRQRLKTEEKYVFDLPVDVKDASGEVIASINKTLYVRKKSR